MDEGRVLLARRGAVAFVTFDRPSARNAMTKAMYRELLAICSALAEDASLRMAVFRGAGGKAFVAGSDIDIFSTFTSGRDGIAYEEEIETYIRALADIPVPTLAVIEGWAVGGGLTLAAVCDIRIATPDARFGVPIARTVGNCLSMQNYGRLASGFGISRAKRMLLLADFIDAEEARLAGFLTEIVAPDALDARVEALCERVLANAPITMRVSKQAIGLLAGGAAAEAQEALIEQAYASEDFKRGVEAFRASSRAVWTGR